MKSHRTIVALPFLACVSASGRRGLAAAIGLASLLFASNARAQVGTGGATATTLSDTDMFLSVQKVQGTNLNPRDQARFLNRAHCKCNSDVWLKGSVLPAPASALRAQNLPSTATVSAFVGYECGNITLQPACQNLGSVSISEFRQFGISRKTTVGEIAKYRIQSSTVVGTGGAGGTGGSSSTGSGGAGTGGAGGSTGTGGSGTGGANGTGGATAVDACDLPAFTQTFWILIGTSGGSADLGSGKLGMLMDVQPPAAPTMAAPGPVHQALLVNWTGLSTTEAADLLGYQILCTRGESTQVFKTGTFTAGFDDTCTSGETPSVPWPDPVGLFACSDILPASTTSYRLKTLENKIEYKVAVASIDKQGNASQVVPAYGVPVLTKDFYFEYRHNEPQGNAMGGFCTVAAGAPVGLDATGGVGLLLGLGVAARAIVRRRARRDGRRRP